MSKFFAVLENIDRYCEELFQKFLESVFKEPELYMKEERYAHVHANCMILQGLLDSDAGRAWWGAAYLKRSEFTFGGGYTMVNHKAIHSWSCGSQFYDPGWVPECMFKVLMVNGGGSEERYQIVRSEIERMLAEGLEPFS